MAHWRRPYGLSTWWLGAGGLALKPNTGGLALLAGHAWFVRRGRPKEAQHIQKIPAEPGLVRLAQVIVAITHGTGHDVRRHHLFHFILQILAL